MNVRKFFNVKNSAKLRIMSERLVHHDACLFTFHFSVVLIEEGWPG